MRELFFEALRDCAAMAPLLFLIYGLVSWLERRFGESIHVALQKAAGSGPLIGALFGCLPQCGFSVLAGALYVKRLITPGTLLAVFLSTSDEALPVILAQPDKASLIPPLLLTKIVIALTGGYAVDLLWRSRGKPADGITGLPDEDEHTPGCCNHRIAGGPRWQELIVHPLIHTVKITVFIFTVTFGLSVMMSEVGAENISRVLFQHSVFQPPLTALVGLIPNCAASIVIAELFLKGGISFGATVSGLCCSAGLGLLVLIRGNEFRDTCRIVLLLFTISTAAGIIIQFLCRCC